MVFLIDYENVTSAGLEGIDKLDPTDSVYIFYTQAQQSLSFDMHRAILETKAKISYFSVANGGKNALDFQLASFIGYLVGLSNDKTIFVVSGDKGFQFIWKFWERQSVEGLSIYTTPSIIKGLKRDRLTDEVKRFHTLDELNITSIHDTAPEPKAEEHIEKEPEPVKPEPVKTVPARSVRERVSRPQNRSESILPTEPRRTHIDDSALFDSFSDLFDVPVKAGTAASAPAVEEAKTEPEPVKTEETAVIEPIPEEKPKKVMRRTVRSKTAKTESTAAEILAAEIQKKTAEAEKAKTAEPAPSAEVQTKAEEIPQEKPAKPARKRTGAKTAKSGKNGKLTERVTEMLTDAGIEGDISTIVDVIVNAADKQKFYSGMTKALGMGSGLEVYKLLRPEYLNLKKMIDA